MRYLKNKEEKLVIVAATLNDLLADYHLYYQKLRNPFSHNPGSIRFIKNARRRFFIQTNRKKGIDPPCRI
jgi:ribosomal protein L30E